MDGKEVRASIDELLSACDKLEALTYGCEVCPLNGRECLMNSSVEDLWNTASERRIQDFLDIAENPDGCIEDYRVELEEREAEEQREYNEIMDELNAGYFRDRRL